MNNLKARAKKAVVYDFGGALITRGGYILFSIFLARLLSPEDFGAIGMILVFTGFAQAIVDMGFSAAIVQAKTVNDVQLSTVFFLNVGLSLLLTSLLFISAPLVAHFYQLEKLKPITESLSFIFVINSLNSVQLSLLRRELKFGIIARASFLATIISGAIAVILAFYGFGVWSLVIQVLTLGLVNVVVVWLSSGWTPRLKFSFNAIRNLWGFGGFMFLDSIFANIYSRVDVFFIGKIFSPTVLGLYMRSKSINNFVVEFSSQSIAKVLFPTVSRVQEDPLEVKQYLLKALDIVGMITFFLLGWMYLTASESIIILFGEKWTGSIVYYQWLALIGYGYPIGSILISALRGQGHSKLYFVRSLLIYAVASIAYIAGFLHGIEVFLQVLVATTAVGVMINIYFSKITTNISFATHLYHSFYFAFVAGVSGLLTLLFEHYVIKLDGLYVAFTCKTLLFTFTFGVMSFLFRRTLIMSLIKNIYK